MEEIELTQQGSVAPDQSLSEAAAPRSCGVLLAASCLAVLGVACSIVLLTFLWSAHAPVRVAWDREVSRSQVSGQLPNGLAYRFVTLPAEDACAVNVFVGAGSNDEPEGAAGAAHLLEHMAFDQAGEMRGRNAVFAALEALGVGYNAFTTFDATVYQSWYVRPTQLAAVLAIHAAQVNEMHLDQRHVAVEVGAVLGEARYSNASFAVGRAVFEHHLRGRRAQWAIGLHADLLQSSGERLDKFWRDNYVANRMEVHVVCGQSAMAQAPPLVPLVQKLFSGVAAGAPGPVPALASGTQSALLLLPPMYSVDGVEVSLMLSRVVNYSATPTYAEVFAAQRFALFDALFTAIVSSRLKGARVVAVETEQPSMLSTAMTQLEIWTGAAGAEYLEHIAATTVATLRQLRDSCDETLVLRVFRLMESGAESLTSSGVASLMAHRSPFAVAEDRQEAQAALVPAACATIRVQAQQLLNSLQGALFQDSCDVAGERRCTLAIAVSPTSGWKSEDVAAVLRRVFAFQNAAVTVSPQLPHVAQLTETRLRGKRRPDIAVTRKRDFVEGGEVKAAPPTLPIVSLSFGDANQTSMAAVYLKPGNAAHLRVIATNRFGPHLCRFLAAVQFDAFFERAGVPYMGRGGVAPRFSCAGKHVQVDYRSPAIDWRWVAASLKPLVTHALVRATAERVGEKRDEESQQGQFGVFSARALRDTVEGFVWGRRDLPTDFSAVSPTVLQQQVWETLSPDAVSLCYVGPPFDTRAAASSLAYRVSRSSLPSAAAASDPLPSPRVFSVSQPASEWGKTEVAYVTRFPRPRMDVPLMDSLLYWKLFRAIRSFGGFSYYAKHDALLLDKESVVLAAHWMVGPDFPVGGDNEKDSAERLRRALQEPLLLDEEWRVTAAGHELRIPRLNTTYAYLLSALHVSLLGGGDVRGLPAAPLLDCFAGAAAPAVSFLRADNTTDGVLREL